MPQRYCNARDPLASIHSGAANFNPEKEPTMSHDPLLEQRIADALMARAVNAEPKKMFGGVAFMVRGHMTVGITNKGDLMARFNGERHAEVLEWPGAKPMTYGKGEMKGFVFVEPAAVSSAKGLAKWLDLALAHNATLPAKKPVAKAAKKAAKKKT